MPHDVAGAKIAPSILAADFARIGEQVRETESAAADRIHVDVMDGHFVQNITMGVPIVKSLRPVTELQIETHLMITDPDNFLDEFDEAGSDLLLVHWEATPNVHRTMHYIRALGNRAGVAINPATPASVLEEILPDISQALVMAVEAGLRTSAVSPHNPAESQRLVPHDRRLNPDCDLAVDRGIDPATARLAVVAGANVLVAGTSVFGMREGVAAGIRSLRASLDLVDQERFLKEVTLCNLE